MPLLFKRCFFEPIRQGAKTQTIRWWHRPMVRAGTLATVPFLAGGRLAIDAVEPVAKLSDLTETDALADGFPSRRAMLATLRAIYPAMAGRRKSVKPPPLPRSPWERGRGEGAPTKPEIVRQLFRIRFHFVATS